MIDLALRSEFSFRQCFGHVTQLAKQAVGAAGIADESNTFGHWQWQKACKAAGIKPIFGVRLRVIAEQIPKKKCFGPGYIFLARNPKGLAQVYALVRKAYERFYYHPQVTAEDVDQLTHDVVVISNSPNTKRIDYVALDHFTPPTAMRHSLPMVAINLNWYPTAEDKHVYELLAGTRLLEQQTFPQHILSTDEWLRIWEPRIGELHCQQALVNASNIAIKCEHFELPKAEKVRYKGTEDIRTLCLKGAKRRGIDTSQGSEYDKRYTREIELIERQGFSDYFLCVSELVRKAKTKMLVGPSRGSSAGSLVCWLLGITELDPIKFDLLFERFIDENRTDLPDIDVDFPDHKRSLVIKDLVKTYGTKHVSHIGTISTLKPRAALNDFANGLMVPLQDLEPVKESVSRGFSGDTLEDKRLEDVFNNTEAGQHFITQYPAMKLTQQVEGHARHSGVHAAGIIVCNEPLTNYGGVNTRDDVLMMDKREAEKQGLLKIDCLGLRTLSILESVAKQIGMKHTDFYKLPLDDKPTLHVFNDLRLDGIFQFQGQTSTNLTRQMGVDCFDDLPAITALARPGPLSSGGAALYIGRKLGELPNDDIARDPIIHKHTADTYGVIIYQEQLMAIAKEYAELTWPEVQQLRKAIGDKSGEEFFDTFKDKFLTGAVNRGANPTDAVKVWEHMTKFGMYGFNKSHAYSYALISYYTAWCKAHHPLEFAVANLNHAHGDRAALKILRDLVMNEGIEYTDFDPDHSQLDWSVKDGRLLGGLMTLKGIGKKKAQAIIAARHGEGKWQPGFVKLMRNAVTPFTVLFPCGEYWGDLYLTPSEVGLDEPPVTINTINKEGTYLFIGKLIDRELRDLNSYQDLTRRGGEHLGELARFVRFNVEDDTGEIPCMINRYNFDELGSVIMTGVEESDWFLIKGRIRDKWRRIDVHNIFNLSLWRPPGDSSGDVPF